MASCLQDCIKSARCWDSPTWQGSSSDDMAWPLSCWQVDTPAGFFVARRRHCQASDVSAYDVQLPAS